MSSDVGVNASKDVHALKTNIYRYKFSDDIILGLNAFAKIHRYDDRITFKEAWIEWTKINAGDIDIESRRLMGLGYTGDVLSKMFKSTRYYFRKKGMKRSDEIEYDEGVGVGVGDGEGEGVGMGKKKYISFESEILEAIDVHIEKHINSDEYSPAWGWDNFCENNKIIISTEIIRILREFEISKEDAIKKLKKAYKNRYFQYTRNVRK